MESSDNVYNNQKWINEIEDRGWPLKCDKLNDDKKECKQETDDGYFGYYNTYKTYKTCQWR